MLCYATLLKVSQSAHWLGSLGLNIYPKQAISFLSIVRLIEPLKISLVLQDRASQPFILM